MATEMEVAAMAPPPSPSPLSSSSSSFINMFRRLATPPSSPAVGRANIPRASSPLAVRRNASSGIIEHPPSPHHTTSTLAIKPLEQNSSSKLHCDAELILKRPTPVKPPRLSTTFGDLNGDAADDDDGIKSNWKSAILAILLSIIVSCLFVALSVPMDALLGVHSSESSTSKQLVASDLKVGFHYQDDIIAGLFDPRTLGHLAAVLSACHEIRVAREAVSEIVMAAHRGLVVFSTARPIVIVNEIVSGIIDAIRTLLLIFF